MTPENKAAFLAFAKTQLPREACGVLIIENGKEVLVTCRNLSGLIDQFEIDALEFAAAEERGEVTGIVHSHPVTNPRPSEADKVSCEATGLPWHIVAVQTGEWFSFAPTGFKAPLVGRTWAHGTLDCYSLIRDYYKEVLGIELLDFDRRHEWWLKGDNLYLNGFREAGFNEVDPKDIRPHDVILIQLRSPVINHGAVYLGDNVMLHHIHKRLSSRDVFDGFWARHTVKVVRHFSL